MSPVNNVSSPKIVAGMFRDRDAAENALSDLKAAGYARAEISALGSDAATGAADASPDASTTVPFFRQHDTHASSFVDELTSLGFAKRDARGLVDGIVAGGAMVTAEAGSRLENAAAILSRYGADIHYADTAGSDQAGRDAGNDRGSEDRELELRAERLRVDKQVVRHGEVRVRKEVVTEIKTIDVPVTHEELVVEQHPVEGQAANAVPIGAGDDIIRIPLSEEKIDVQKHTVASEDVTIGKRRVSGAEHISETLRHEELRVDDPNRPTTP